MRNPRSNAKRLGQFLAFQDHDGVRHMVRIFSIQVLSDADLDAQETLLVAANRMYCVPCALEDLARIIDPQVTSQSDAMSCQ